MPYIMSTNTSQQSIPVKKPVTTGRGGAGNMSSNPGAKTEADLSTPAIKSSKYTTGRGGKGNMARNDPSNPGEARIAQDVTPVVRAHSTFLSNDASAPSNTGAKRASPPRSVPGMSTGRGGGGNIARSPNQSHSRDRQDKLTRRGSDEGNVVEGERKGRRRTGSGLAEKGKDLLRRAAARGSSREKGLVEEEAVE